MDNSKAKLICLLFRLKPAIKNSVEKDKYQQTVNSFEKHYSEIDARVDHERGILAFHRRFLITGLALYKALHGEFQNQEELIEKIHPI